MRQAVVIQHVAFEGLGTLEPALRTADFTIRQLQAGVDDLAQLDPIDCDLLIVLGGPVGVYEQAAYPWLSDELALLRTRLAARRATLGICLGAQLMAAALDTAVYPGHNGKEIGWSPLTPGDAPVANDASPDERLAPLFVPGVEVLHWHGDTFDLPAGATRLAGTPLYSNQAFAIEDFALALQFHAEVTAAGMERWFIGNAVELAQARVSVTTLRQHSRERGPALEKAARALWGTWLQRCCAGARCAGE
jgi:GMP synthase (glutamine-hydrolysing)